MLTEVRKRASGDLVRVRFRRGVVVYIYTYAACGFEGDCLQPQRTTMNPNTR